MNLALPARFGLVPWVAERRELLQFLLPGDAFPPDAAAGEKILAQAEENSLLLPAIERLWACSDGRAVSPDRLDLVHQNAARLAELRAAAEGLAARLTQEGVRHCLVEGASAYEVVRGRAPTYSAGDYDFAVEEGGLARADEWLRSEGFEPTDRRGRPTKRVEYCRADPNGRTLWLEVGEDIYDRMHLPLHIEDPTPLWLDRTERVPGTAFRVLVPTLLLAQLGLHASFHHYVEPPGLRLYLEMAGFVQQESHRIVWDELVLEALGARSGVRILGSLLVLNGLSSLPEPAGDSLMLAAEREWRLQRLPDVLERMQGMSGARRLASHALLDYLLSERAAPVWAGRALWPTDDWLREHSEALPSQGGALDLLSARIKRFQGLLSGGARG
jgi:hypothetical protein